MEGQEASRIMKYFFTFQTKTGAKLLLPKTNFTNFVLYWYSKQLTMVSSSEIISLIKSLSLTDRLKIVEEVLRNIREENMTKGSNEKEVEPPILSLAGIIDEEEAKIWNSAVEESRQIDEDEW